ncbi:Uncharacterized protein SCG7086_AK_00230 [Chlamydiales bacterium SCGC AG-110-P3]|nr:Uncharacterized protein SCG7086_AK_00230 [Chlamydiales bacterium SCGC AG-110-P3]
MNRIRSKLFRYTALLVVCLGYVTSCGIAQTHVYVVARDPSWYPLQLMGREAKMSAFSDDLLWEIARREGFKVATVRTGPGGIERGLDSGEFDAVLTTMVPNAVHRESYVYSDPYFYSGPMLVVPIHSDIKNLEDMAGLELAVQSGTLGLYQIDTETGIVFRFFDNIIKGVEQMIKGDIDGVVMDLVPAYGYANGIYRDEIKLVGQPLSKASMRLVTSRNNSDELVAYFNHGLKEVKEDGTYKQLLEKWGLHQDENVIKQ